jgi:hypothetical protein
MDKFYHEALTAAGQSGNNFGKFSSEPIEKRAPFTGAIEEANRRLADVSARVEAIADRICGGSPRLSQGGSVGSVPTPVPNGLVEGIETTGREQLARIETISRELDRIESVLPF